jgi:pectate lyase
VYEGFGATTPGGAQGTVVHVTNLNDTGPGSLREAVRFGNRFVVFDVTGEIVLTSEVDVRGAFITIDGSSAPSPGITLINDGLNIEGTKGAHDVIVKGLRVRQAQGDGISIGNAAYNIVIDHVSVHGSSDGGIDATDGTSDVTIQWSIFAENIAAHNLVALVEYQPQRVTFHHNLFVRGQSRNPHSGWDRNQTTNPPDTVTDFRNNLVWLFLEYGSQILNNTHANAVNNFYYSALQPSADRALAIRRGGKVFAQGNFSLNGANVNALSNRAQPFPAAPVNITDACTAAQQIVEQAGVHPRDAIDLQYLALITSLPSDPCP